jgi:hypothetical protein
MLTEICNFIKHGFTTLMPFINITCRIYVILLFNFCIMWPSHDWKPSKDLFLYKTKLTTNFPQIKHSCDTTGILVLLMKEFKFVKVVPCGMFFMTSTFHLQHITNMTTIRYKSFLLILGSLKEHLYCMHPVVCPDMAFLAINTTKLSQLNKSNITVWKILLHITFSIFQNLISLLQDGKKNVISQLCISSTDI